MNEKQHKFTGNIVAIFYLCILVLLVWVVTDQNKLIDRLTISLDGCTSFAPITPEPIKKPSNKRPVIPAYQGLADVHFEAIGAPQTKYRF
ncbi:MAG: hypothetical protein KJO69_05730 [Gammaproteobacteria bacterium]|nr:hypothetical protein [Gammaproteobacteria bacterium]